MSVPPPWPTVTAGEINRAVKAMQNGLHRYLAEQRQPHEHLRNGGYGSRTIASVNRFKSLEGLGGGGRVFGTAAWRELEPWLGGYDRSLIRRHLEDVREARSRMQAAKARRDNPRERLRALALAFHAARSHYRYVQTRPMPSCLLCPEAYRRLDCSSLVTVIYREAGCDDPNGLGYNGQGYTGTLWARGTLTQRPQAGDLAFYGFDRRGNFPSHVAICISPDEVVSFGSDPPRRASLRYRGDYRGVRVYL